MFLPFALGVVARLVLAVKLGYRLAPRTLLVIGGLLTAAGFAWFGLISPDGAFTTDVLGPSIVASVGFGLCLGLVVSTATAASRPTRPAPPQACSTAHARSVPRSELAALATVAHHRTGQIAAPRTLNDGYALGLTLSAALLVAAVLIALTVLRRTSPTPPAEHAEKRKVPLFVPSPTPDQARQRRAVDLEGAQSE